MLQRFKEKGVTLNKTKCVFKVKRVDFLGHCISPNGVRLLTPKISTIKNNPTPTNLPKLHRFMDMAQQLSKFTNQLATATEPLWELLSSKTTWTWTIEHDNSFKKVKDILANHTRLYLYNTKRPIKLRVDSSKLNGISAILYQQHNDEWFLVSCASHFLSEYEKNYHPIEIKMLTISWVCKKMYMYLHRLSHFRIQTNHKPLIPILNNKMLVDMSPRIQQMKITLLPYTFTAKHVKGTTSKDADPLSRAPTDKPSHEDQLAEQVIINQVNTIVQTMPATDRELQNICYFTKHDSGLQKLQEVMLKRWPNFINQCPAEVQP